MSTSTVPVTLTKPLHIAGLDAYSVAWNEWLAVRGKDIPEASRQKIDALVRGYTGAIDNGTAYARAFVALEAKVAAGDAEALDALVLLVRANDIAQCQKTMGDIKGFNSAAEMDAYARVTLPAIQEKAEKIVGSATPATDASATAPQGKPSSVVPIESDVQFALEKILLAAGDEAKDLDTGTKNRAAILRGETTMDCKRGPHTNKAIA